MAACLRRRAADFSGKCGGVCSGSSGGANQNGRPSVGSDTAAGCACHNAAFPAREDRLSGCSAGDATFDSAEQMIAQPSVGKSATMSNRTALNVIEVQKPCPADWEAMSGGATTRFCAHCQKNVYNFSAMTRDEAQNLICESAGHLCARFTRSETGDVITLDYQPAPRRRQQWQYWMGAAFLAAT